MSPAEQALLDATVERTDGRVVGRRVSLRIGRQTLRIRSDDPRVRFFLHDTHAPFVVSDDELVDCDIVWRVGDVAPSRGPAVDSNAARWELRTLATGEEEMVFRDAVGAPPVVMIRTTRSLTRAEITRAPEENERYVIFASDHPWTELLVCRMLGRSRGLLVHASAVVRDGAACLFVGHSGAGKSTLAELAEGAGAVVLSDDRSIVIPAGDGMVAWGTPWHGSLARTSPAAAPIGAVFLIVQDGRNAVERLSASRAAKEIFVRLIQPRLSEREVAGTLETLEALVERVPAYELRFTPTMEAVELAMSVVADAAVTAGDARPLTPLDGGSKP